MISIIVPIYNKQNQIKRCLDSVKCQSYEDWELILVDDGSTDNSASIIKPFLSDSRIHYFYKENGGVSSARNVGLEKAIGEWIIFLDSDDYFLPEGLAILLHTALQRKVKVSAANFYVEKEHKRYGQCTGRSRIVKNNFRAWYFMTCYPRAGAALFYTTVVKKKLFDEALCRYEDVKFLFPIMREYRIAYSSDYVMVYTDGSDGLSKQIPCLSKNYVFAINCFDGSFWEKIVCARLVRQELSVYTESGISIKQNLRKVSLFMFIELVLSSSVLPVSIINRIYRKFRLY